MEDLQNLLREVENTPELQADYHGLSKELDTLEGELREFDQPERIPAEFLAGGVRLA